MGQPFLAVLDPSYNIGLHDQSTLIAEQTVFVLLNNFVFHKKHNLPPGIIWFSPNELNVNNSSLEKFDSECYYHWELVMRLEAG